MAYSTSKAAVIGMVKAAGKEYAETGITVNALAPAVVMTPLVEGTDPAVVKSNTDKIAMKRCTTTLKLCLKVQYMYMHCIPILLTTVYPDIQFYPKCSSLIYTCICAAPF